MLNISSIFGCDLSVLNYYTYLALLDVDVLELPSLEDLEAHVALLHVEQLLALLQVVVLALVRSANIKHLEDNKTSMT